jgi:hypothetical protein
MRTPRLASGLQGLQSRRVRREYASPAFRTAAIIADVLELLLKVIFVIYALGFVMARFFIVTLIVVIMRARP